MKNFGNIFWAFFFFFCLIPYPILHYYSRNSDFSIQYLQNKDPKISLGLLMLTISLWLLLLGCFFYRAIIMPFVMNSNLEKLKYSGVKREAKILNASKISTTSSNFPVYDLDLSFENLSHREIKEKNFRIIDSKPYEKRFEAGKSLSIMLDESIKYPPYFSFEPSTNKVNIKSIVSRSLFLILFIAVVIYFYFFAYTTENQGMGWRFLSIKHHYYFLQQF